MILASKHIENTSKPLSYHPLLLRRHIHPPPLTFAQAYEFNNPLTLSTLPTLFSNSANRSFFSRSLFSNTSTLISNFALAFLSAATISFASVKSCVLSSSSSACDVLSLLSAAWRRFCSRESCARRSAGAADKDVDVFVWALSEERRGGGVVEGRGGVVEGGG